MTSVNDNLSLLKLIGDFEQNQHHLKQQFDEIVRTLINVNKDNMTPVQLKDLYCSVNMIIMEHEVTLVNSNYRFIHKINNEISKIN